MGHWESSGALVTIEVSVSKPIIVHLTFIEHADCVCVCVCLTLGRDRKRETFVIYLEMCVHLSGTASR